MAKAHTSRAHADYAPSSSDRWMGCIGSTQLIRKVHPKGAPNTQSHATASGTAIHEKAEEYLVKDCDIGIPADIIYKLNGKDNKIPPSDWVPHVEGYIGKVREIAEELEFFTGEKATIVVEGKVKIVDPHCWGSVDCYIYAGNVLYVIDLKTGRGHIVSAEENSQFKTYAAGICIKYKWKFDEIHLCRYQAPDEAHPFDDWVTTKAALMGWVEELRETIKISEDGDGDLVAGDHCLWCPAKAECPKQRETAMSVFDDEEAATLLPVDTLSREQMTFLLVHAKQITDYLKAVSEHALTQALDNPEILPEFKVVEGRSIRKWNRSEENIAAALSFEEIDVNDLYEPAKLKSFTKVEKVIGKARFAELDLVEKPPGKPTLVPITDKRTPINALRFEGFQTE